jgi:hypothetical protein
MNERIRSLLDRAEYQAEKYPGPDWEVYVEPSREQILQKFAELIIEECGRAADNAPQPVVRFLPYLMQHFGVE